MFDTDLMREDDLKCPHCGLRWRPARVTELYTELASDQWGEYEVRCLIPSNTIRCVECKRDYGRELTEEQKSHRDEIVESARAGSATRRVAIFEWVE